MTYKREQQPNTYTYTTFSGNVRIIYYPRTGTVEISKKHKNEFVQVDWSKKDTLALDPEDVQEADIYLLGLQPHIREVLARKEKDVPEPPAQELPEDEQEDSQAEEAEQN